VHINVATIKLKKVIIIVFQCIILKFNEMIHQKWSFGFFKSKFGTLDQNRIRIIY